MEQNSLFPPLIPNWIEGEQCSSVDKKQFDKLSPHDGKRLCQVARSSSKDIENVIMVAKKAQQAWADTPPVQRGDLLYAICNRMDEFKENIAQVVALETGKSFKEALGETKGAIALGRFFASEGQRFYGHTTSSGVLNRYAMTIRQPIGVAGLIVAANTPIANVAWKVFPALLCGNAVVLKAAEDAPATAWFFAKIAHETTIPIGLFNVVQGYGEEAGASLVAHQDVDIISFTGSTAVGCQIAVVAGKRLAKVSLELGGKNPFVVCDDADLDNAAKWGLLSAFSNAGQRCASGSRIIIFDAIYNEFRDMLMEHTKRFRVGPTDDDDFGPVINEEQLVFILNAVERVQKNGATILTGGYRLSGPKYNGGFYMAPTLIEHVAPSDEISRKELFGSVACLYRVQDFENALAVANNSPYGLTACIHTRNLHRAIQFTQKIQAGIATVNAGTYGSEPHMPFGGWKNSGNGFREPGTEALNVYSELKNVCINIDSNEL